MHRISVVIPCFNHARFVGEAIASVAAQQIPDLELVVIDDGSSDASVERIRETLASLRLERVHFLEQSNRGTHVALARGIEASSGDVIAILNSDDRFHPDRLEQMLGAVPADRDFLAFSKVNLIGPTGETLAGGDETVAGYRHALYEATRCPTVGFGLLRNNFAVSSGNLLFTRTLYEKIGGFRAFRLAHDWDFLLQALFHVEPIFVPAPLLDYRTHGTTTRTQLGHVAAQEGRAILHRYFALCEQGSPPNPLAPCRQNWPLYFDVFAARYHTWFGRGPIEDWLEREPEDEQRARAAAGWQPWSEAVDFARVDDCRYLTDPNLEAERRDALAVAREVLIAEAHPLADEQGPGKDGLRQVFARHAYPMPSMREPVWVSPLQSPALRLREGSRGRALARRIARRLRPVLERAPGLAARWEIWRSGVFDAQYYRDQCRERGIRTIDPMGHYLRTGAALGLDPHPLFCTQYYVTRNPGIDADVNPLVHYLTQGDREGRMPHPLFDPAWYRAEHPDVAAGGRAALIHLVKHGGREGRRAHPRLDSRYYTQELGREDVASAFQAARNPLVHYARVGRARGIALDYREALRLRIAASGTLPGLDPETRDAETQQRADATVDLLRRSPWFDAVHYARRCGGDFDGLEDAARHFFERGALEGVAFCPPERLREQLERVQHQLEAEEHAEFRYLGARDVAQRGSGHRVRLYVSSMGNVFFHEMATLLAQGFRATGADVEVLDESRPMAVPERDEHSIVVSPHEFFALGDGPTRLSAEVLRHCSLWVAEQPGSEYFGMCLWFARFARRILDINPLTALVWKEFGAHARALPLGWVADLPDYADAIEFTSPEIRASLAPEAQSPVSVDAPLRDRPLDVFFNGVMTERRSDFFVRNAAFFASLRCALFLPVPHRPVGARVPSSLNARDATALSQRSQILLNVHRGELPYLEWHRVVVRGIWQKTLVVSEPSHRVPGFEPGEHYLEADLAELPELLAWLLHSEDGQREAERVRTSAFARLTQRYSLAAMAGAFLAEDSEEASR